jgi:hypothetical protein
VNSRSIPDSVKRFCEDTKVSELASHLLMEFSAIVARFRSPIIDKLATAVPETG